VKAFRLSGIGTRLLGLVGLVVAALLAVAALVFFSFGRIERLVAQQASAEVSSVLANAALGRELSLVLARLNQLALACRSERTPAELLRSLRASLGQLRPDGPNPLLASAIGEFAASGGALLDACERVGATLAEAAANDRQLLEVLAALENTVARALIEQTMAARSVDHLDQAMAQLTGFRETVLLAGRQLGRPQSPANPGKPASPPRTQLQELAVRLQGFVSATPEMSRQATELRALVLRQVDTLGRLDATLQSFDDRIAGTQKVRDALLRQVASLDGDAAERTASLDSTLQRVIQQSRLNVTAAVALVAAAALLLALLLIRSGIRRPLDEVLAQVNRIRSGAQPQPAPARADEWGQIQTALATMSSELTQASAELEQALAAARSAAEAKGQFIANVSHEIRTPLNAALGMLKLLQSTGLSARQADYVAKTEAATRSLLALINDILDFSKIEARQMKLDIGPLQLDELVRNIGVLLGVVLERKPVELLIDIDPRIPRRLRGDALRLQQVLLNLGSNAIKFTAQGEVVLRIALRESDERTVLLEFSVRDTGIGIAPDQQTRIFEGFSQAEASITRRFGGTGLGLAISRDLVALMGGSLGVISEPGRGSTFHFAIVLPVDDAPATADNDASGLRDLDVLVVDDHPAARDVLGAMARSLGWRVTLAASGAEAIAIARERIARGVAFDVAFVDWEMPGMDGWESARALRTLAGATPAVLMVTAHGREAMARRTESDIDGLNGFLVKPITASMLLDAVVDARRAPGGVRREAAPRPAPVRQRPLAGLRLLVVEDNAGNRQVAQELLESRGAQVALAEDGQRGVDAVIAADPPFDAVLMDMQMPVMDGVAATARIREIERLRTLPIVAMTANTTEADRRVCLLAGMSEHVGKPFDLDRLVDTLRALTGRGAKTGPRATALPALAGAAWREAAAAGVDLATALGRFDGDVPVYERLLRNALDEIPSRLVSLRTQLSAADMPGASATLHALKGLAGALGADALAAEAGTGERACRDDDPGAAAATQPCLEEAARELLLYGPRLAAALREPPQSQQARGIEPGMDASGLEVADGLQLADTCADSRPAGVGASAPDARDLLGRLAAVLRASDMRAFELLDEGRPALLRADPALLAGLDTAMDALDFEHAARLCDAALASVAASGA
jgi:signal transduction histidine kinase/DNA-binding response OmpR family regulator/HPt (histidine-containing phosphotransfer) domain-containing protein